VVVATGIAILSAIVFIPFMKRRIGAMEAER